MKTTVKTSDGKAIVSPLMASGNVLLSIGDGIGCGYALEITPDQCGALIFGMEQALEVIDQRHRAALETMRAAA